MEPEEASERRRGWRCAAVRCAVVLAGGALLVATAALTLLLLRGQESPDGAEKLRETRKPLQQSQACAELLEDGSPVLKNRRLKWVVSSTTGCKTFGEEFDYDNDSGMLKIKYEYKYHISAQMATECLLKECGKQNITLIIHHKTAQNSDPILTLSLHLNPRSNSTLSASMAILFPLKQNDLLYVTLTTSTSDDSTESKGWQLKNPDTIFRISRELGALSHN